MHLCIADRPGTEKLINHRLHLSPLFSYKMVYEISTGSGNHYLRQDGYSSGRPGPYRPPLLYWPAAGYFDHLRPDAELLEQAVSSAYRPASSSIAEQVFGSRKRQQHTALQHTVNLLRERAELHRRHIQDIDHRHSRLEAELFCVRINNFPDRARRLSNLEGQLLQLEGQRRDEELAFWKDSVELRQKLFEAAEAYSSAKHRYAVFSQVEEGGEYG